MSHMFKGANDFNNGEETSNNPITWDINDSVGNDINMTSMFEGTIRFKHTILSINGDYDTRNIRKFIDDSLLARDARALRKYIGEIQPGINMEVNVEFKDGYIENNVTLPINVNFFWPDAEL